MEIGFILSAYATIVVSMLFGATIMYAYLKGEKRIIPKNECIYTDEDEQFEEKL